MRIAAFDLSLVETGYAVAVNGVIQSYGVIHGQGKGVERMIDIRNKVLSKVREVKQTLVVVEEAPFGTKLPYSKENAGLNYGLQMELFYSFPYVLVSAMGLKKFVAGRGKAEVTKEEMIAAIKLPPFGTDQSFEENNNGNVADAIGLAFLGMALHGSWPMTTKAQREAVETVRKNSRPVLRGV